MEILLYVGVFYGGFFIGFLLHWWLIYRRSYDGKIVVTQDQNKIVYSLELEDYPEVIQFRKEIILKVDTSDESLDRN